MKVKEQDVQCIYRLDKAWGLHTIKIGKAGGQTNRNFVIAYKNKKFFVRLPWGRGDIIDRKIEGKNILALTKNRKLAEILPKYHTYILNKRNILARDSKDFFDVPDGTMVTEYIEGKEFTYRLFQKKEYQKALAKTLYAFHASGVQFCNIYDVFVDEIQKYRAVAQQYPLFEVVDKKTVLKFEKLEKEAKRKLMPLKSNISTHNDFIFQNFLIGKNKKVYLLDFEYAGLNKRGGIYYDFGFLFADNLFRDPQMTKEIFEDFLSVSDKIYGQRLDRQQIYAGALATVIMQFWWSILRYFSVDTKKEKKYFAKYLLDRVKGVTLAYSFLDK